MAISLHTAGSWAAATATTQTVTLPTHSTGDMLLVRVGFKHATMPTTVTCGTAGWAKLGEKNGGTNASGNGTGSCQVAVFWKEAASAAETNPVITFNGGVTAATPSAAVANAYSKAANEAWLTPVGDGAAIAAATSISATIASHVSATSGDLVEVAIITNDNTTLTVPTFTQAGLTLAAVVESPATALSSTTSNDIAADGCYRIATSGTSSAAAVVTGTNSVADEGVAWTTRLRVVVSDPQLVTPGVVNLTTSTFAPTVTATQNVTVTPDVAALATSAFAPVVTASDHKSVTPGVVALATATFAPSVTVGINVVPATVALVTAAFVPTVTASDHQTVTPGVLATAMTAFAPTVVLSDHQLVTPSVASLALATFAPIVTAGSGGAVSVTPGPLALTLTTYAPTVTGDVEDEVPAAPPGVPARAHATPPTPQSLPPTAHPPVNPPRYTPWVQPRWRR